MPRVKCPNCAAAAPEGGLECPACGVIFAKLAELRQREKAEAKAHAALLDAPAPARAPDPRNYRRLAIAIVLAWMAGLAAFVHVSARRFADTKEAPSDAVRPPTVIMRDPVTGELKELTIRERRTSVRTRGD